MIVRGDGLQKLEEVVNEAMGRFFRPVGGPFRIPGDDSRDIWYGQAMVYQEPPDNPPCM